MTCEEKLTECVEALKTLLAECSGEESHSTPSGWVVTPFGRATALATRVLAHVEDSHN